MKFFASNKNKGFSLVELMIVVAIIGILATIAAPRYRQFSAKAKQSEAKTTLGSIATMQESYRAEYDTYSTAANIGFTAPTGARYTYNVASAAPTATTYISNAYVALNGLGQGCSADEWNINESRSMGNPIKTAC